MLPRSFPVMLIAAQTFTGGCDRVTNLGAMFIVKI